MRLRPALVLVAFALIATGCGDDPIGDASLVSTTLADDEASQVTSTEPVPRSTAATGGVSEPTLTTVTAPTSVATDGVSGPTPTAASSTTTTVATPQVVAARVRPEGRDAPNFALDLGQGGVFRLSDEQKPVFMVFWAEW